MSTHQPLFHPHQSAVKIPLWREIFLLRELLKLRTHPIFQGHGIPAGDGAAVITIPGFLCSDSYTNYLTKWLAKIGYFALPSGLEQNNGCIEKMIAKLSATVEQAADETNNKVHLIGHSLGGVLARIAATRKPELISSVITLGSPFRGIRAHPYILRLGDRVRTQLQTDEAPHCFTGFCECPSILALQNEFPATVRHCAIYTKSDGVVDWEACVSSNANYNNEVTGTHSGLVFNPQVFALIAEELSKSVPPA